MLRSGRAASDGASGRAARAGGLRHLTVIEQAHLLFRRGGAAGLFAGLLAEIGAYGEGLIVAEQIPDRLARDVIKNTAVKIAHRLPAADDRDVVGATMNMTRAQRRYLVTLGVGEAAVFADGMDIRCWSGCPDPRPPKPPARALVRTPGQPGRRGDAAQRHLRRRLRRAAVHAAGHADSPARPR